MEKEPLQDSLEIHLWDYVRVVLSRIHIALTVFLGVLILAMIWTFTRAQRYEATARIEIKRTSVKLVQDEGAMDESGPTGYDREFVPTQMKLLSSEPVLEKVLRRVGQQPEFKSKREPIRALAQMFKVQQVRNSRLIEVRCMREKPKQAAELVNSLIDSFKEFNREQRQGVAEEGLKELEKKKEELRQKLAQAENDIRDFREKEKITSFEEEARKRMAELIGLNESYYKTEPFRIKLKAQVEAADQAILADRSLRSLPSIIQSPLIIPMLQDLSRLEIQLQDSLSRLGRSHRDVLSLENQIKALTSNIDSTSQAVIEALKTEYEIAKKEAEFLFQTINDKEAAVAKLAEQKSEYEFLLKNKDAIERNYDGIVDRMEDIDLATIQGHGQTVFEISRAKPPLSPAWPSKKRNFLLASILGILLGVGACFFLDYMDTTVKGIEDIREIYRCEVLGTLPPIGSELAGEEKEDFLALAKPRSHFAESFRMIRTNLTFAGGDKPIKTIAVSSALPSEGKSIVSINIGIAQAQLSKRVLLVDADMRKPRLHRAFEKKSENGKSITFQVENNYGLADLLAEENPETKIEEAAIDVPQEKNLFLIPSGTRPGNPAELLDSPKFLNLLSILQQHYDFIIFDSPPCASLVDSFIIGKAVDGLIVVVKTFSTQKAASSFLADNLRNSGIRILGAVCNNKEAPKTGRLAYYYGYGRYGYGYGQGSGYYYTEDEDDNNGTFLGKWRRKKEDSGEVVTTSDVD